LRVVGLKTRLLVLLELSLLIPAERTGHGAVGGRNPAAVATTRRRRIIRTLFHQSIRQRLAALNVLRGSAGINRKILQRHLSGPSQLRMVNPDRVETVDNTAPDKFCLRLAVQLGGQLDGVGQRLWRAKLE
jgi:hypothetical protein